MEGAFQGLDKALRWLRLQKQRKQREVADAAGVTQAMLCSYEQGKRRPSLASLEKILTTLEVDLADLSRVLALVNGSDDHEAGDGQPLVPPPARAQLAGDVEEAPVDLYLVLGNERRLPPETEEAFNQMLAGFCSWLRILHASTPAPKVREDAKKPHP